MNKNTSIKTKTVKYWAVVKHPKSENRYLDDKVDGRGASIFGRKYEAQVHKGRLVNSYVMPSQRMFKVVRVSVTF